MFSERPYIYEIEPTNHCPYRCIMCPRGIGKMTREKGFIDLDLFTKILSSFPEGQKVVRLHHFGEAVLHPEIDTMIRMVRKSGLLPVISLNPATLTHELSGRLVDAEPAIVCFSLDAFDDNGLRKIRGIRRQYEECVELMENFFELSRRGGHSILKVVQTVALDLDRLCPREGTEAYDTGKELDLLKKRFPGKDVLFYSAENTGFGDLNLVEATRRGGSKILKSSARPCAAPFSEVSILWNGDVVLCCYDYDGFNVIGNINNNTIEEIWRGEKIASLREIFMKRGTGELELCSKCFLAPHRFDLEQPLSEKNLSEERVLLDLYSALLDSVLPDSTLPDQASQIESPPDHDLN